MLAGTDTLAAITNDWLSKLERGLASGDERLLQTLFLPDSHWRDLLALTWGIRTVSGQGSLIPEMNKYSKEAEPRNFRVDSTRTAPRYATRAGTSAVEAIFKFETAVGRCSGVLRLMPDPADGGTPKAWTFHTALDEMKGHEERVGKLRPIGQSYSRDFGGPNWLDLRKAAAEYADRDPVVLVVGGGQAGLSIAARLGALQVDTLIVDRWPRIGDNWRKRYHPLTLHNQVHVNHLPYLPFPPTFPVYIPKDKLAGWFEAYAEALELNYWSGTEFEGGTYDDREKRWSVVVRKADGARRTLRPRHVVMATGVSGIPNLPDLPALKGFSGKVLHSSQYVDGEDWSRKKAVVVGTGNSGHDIAQDLHSSGAAVTLLQRSPTLVVNIEPSAQLVYGLYSEGPPLEDCDLITTSIPLKLSRRSHQLATAHAKKLDQPLLEALAKKGFRLDDGEDGTGWQFKYLTRGGGYYFNVGCSELIVEGKIGFAQLSELDRFLKDADLVVLATGYKGQEQLVRKLFGEAVAGKVGAIWGFGEDQELRNMFARTAQTGLWFIAGSFAQSRIYSKVLALQIKAMELGLLQ